MGVDIEIQHVVGNSFQTVQLQNSEMFATHTKASDKPHFFLKLELITWRQCMR